MNYLTLYSIVATWNFLESGIDVMVRTSYKGVLFAILTYLDDASYRGNVVRALYAAVYSSVQLLHQ